MIDSYSFGRIVIDGKTYTSDVIIYPDKIDDNWWRESGHLVQREDLGDVLKYKPEVLIIGTGAHGLMKVTDDTGQLVKSKGIRLITKETEEACKTYNKLKEKKKVAALHLTC